MDNELLKLLAEGCTVLTPTVRLSRYLQYRYAIAQLNAGRESWPTPDCLPWTAWLLREWQELNGKSDIDLYLLNSGQREWLWQEIIRQSRYGEQLLQTSSTARQAMAAYDLCRAYDIEIFPADQYLNEDARACKNWVGRYEEQLQRSGQVDEARLPDILIQYHDGGESSARKIILYGFDELTPQQGALTGALQSSGATITVYPVAERNASVAICRARNTHDEIRQAANWCRQILERSPDAGIGIICPQLPALRQALVYRLDALLVPATLLSSAAEQDKPYNIALGRPLSESPAIHTALNILRLGQQRVPLSVISQLLLSPFIRGAENELSRRGSFDARLRELGESGLTLKTVFRVASDHCRPYQQCPQFIEMLKAFDIRFLSCPRKQGAGGWAQSFSDLLKQFNWPGERSLNSEEYQVLEAWKGMLVQLASLDHVAGKMGYDQALGQLAHTTGETRFQPQTAEAPVQVMGPAAVAGMQFDYLWFMGCHDQAWPPARQPNPFIPLSLQRQAGIAAAGAESHMQQYRELTRKMIRSAREAVISYPQQEEDRLLRASPVIKMFGEKAKPFFPQPIDDVQHRLQASGNLDYFVDEEAPVIRTTQTTTGGSGIFRDQALCPFRSFARHRLHARALATVDTGLNPVNRGLLVHEVMQNFWMHDRDSAGLADADEERMQKRIDKSIRQALKKFSKQQPETLTENFIELEQYRLHKLLEEWVAIEQERTPFTVREVEQWHTVEFAGMKIQMRIDRIDELAGGELVIIDYKTGNVNVNEWLEERPGDPQLPLYAVTTSGHVAAIVYGKVKRGECKYLGLAEDENLLPSVRAPGDMDWESRVAQWETILSGLAREFQQGVAAVMPRDDKACAQCDLHGFCRIYERIEFAAGEQAND